MPSIVEDFGPEFLILLPNQTIGILCYVYAKAIATYIIMANNVMAPG